jgi:hypothetical protein
MNFMRSKSFYNSKPFKLLKMRTKPLKMTGYESLYEKMDYGTRRFTNQTNLSLTWSNSRNMVIHNATSIKVNIT